MYNFNAIPEHVVGGSIIPMIFFIILRFFCQEGSSKTQLLINEVRLKCTGNRLPLNTRLTEPGTRIIRSILSFAWIWPEKKLTSNCGVTITIGWSTLPALGLLQVTPGRYLSPGWHHSSAAKSGLKYLVHKVTVHMPKRGWQSDRGGGVGIVTPSCGTIMLNWENIICVTIFVWWIGE